jgi:metal-responsive CopG/Arc/MetJ family transcriptional regulator
MTQVARVHVLIPDDEAGRFDAYCKEKGFKKSTLIVRLIREHLDRERFQTQQELFDKRPRRSLNP